MSLLAHIYAYNELFRVLDYIGVMTYDYHESSEGRTGQNSPLYASHVDSDKSENAAASIKEWIDAGASPSRLLLGLGFYGHSFKLASSKNHGIGAKTVGAGEGDGELSYAQVSNNFFFAMGRVLYNFSKKKITRNLSIIWFCPFRKKIIPTGSGILYHFCVYNKNVRIGMYLIAILHHRKRRVEKTV